MRRIREFVKKYPTRRYERNQLILLKDDTPDYLFAIKNGFVKGYDIDSQGNEQLIWLGAQYDMFPIVWAFSLNAGTQLFFSAFTDVELYAVNRSEFLAFLEDNHLALLEMTKELVSRFNDALNQLGAAEKNKAEEKIVHTLYFLSLRFGHIDFGDENTDEAIKKHFKNSIKLPVTHQDIANLLGLTRETVTTQLKKLKDSGYIYYDKSCFFINQRKLTSLL